MRWVPARGIRITRPGEPGRSGSVLRSDLDDGDQVPYQSHLPTTMPIGAPAASPEARAAGVPTFRWSAGPGTPFGCSPSLIYLL